MTQMPRLEVERPTWELGWGFHIMLKEATYYWLHERATATFLDTQLSEEMADEQAT